MGAGAHTRRKKGKLAAAEIARPGHPGPAGEPAIGQPHLNRRASSLRRSVDTPRMNTACERMNKDE